MRLSSTRAKERCQCVNQPATGISSPGFPQDVFRVSNGHGRDDSKIEAWQVNEKKKEFSSLFLRYHISLGSRCSSAKPRDHTFGGL